MAFDPIVNRAIGQRLRDIREARSLTRERLAEYADISVQFLADIETGRKGMTAQTLRKLALALHCSADAIVFDIQDRVGAEGSEHSPFAQLNAAQAGMAEDIAALVLKWLPDEHASHP